LEQIRSTQLAGTLVFLLQAEPLQLQAEAPLAKLCLAFKGDKKW